MRGVVWCTVSLFYFTVSDFFVLICYAFHVVLCCCSLYDFNHLVAFEINFQALVSFWYLSRPTYYNFGVLGVRWTKNQQRHLYTRLLHHVSTAATPYWYGMVWCSRV